MKATNKPEKVRYYEIKADHIAISKPFSAGVSIEFNTDIKAVKKAYAPLKLYKFKV